MFVEKSYEEKRKPYCIDSYLYSILLSAASVAISADGQTDFYFFCEKLGLHRILDFQDYCLVVS